MGEEGREGDTCERRRRAAGAKVAASGSQREEGGRDQQAGGRTCRSRHAFVKRLYRRPNTNANGKWRGKESIGEHKLGRQKSRRGR
jgi:hypothetical protein